MHQLSQRFYFDAAHTLNRASRPAEEADSSKRIHGHTYWAELMLEGEPDPRTGMVVDLGLVRPAHRSGCGRNSTTPFWTSCLALACRRWKTCAATSWPNCRRHCPRWWRCASGATPPATAARCRRVP